MSSKQRSQAGVEAARRRTPWVPFDDPAAVHHHDAIGGAYRRQPVSDHQRGAALHQPFERLLDQPLAFRVERAGRFVEQQDRRIAQQGPRNRQALALPAREPRPALSQKGVEPVG